MWSKGVCGVQTTRSDSAACEQWGVYEVALSGREDGNPFADYDIAAEFRSPSETVRVNGFYDGDGRYVVRFMPSFRETYTYEVSGSFSEEVHRGTFTAGAPSCGNHGPVRVKNTYHFAYEDGTAHYSIGTTAYAFAVQPAEIVESTFRELERRDFNKVRICVFPKHYDFCLDDPVCFPYEGEPMDASVLTRQNFMEYDGTAPGNHWDFHRFNPEFFQLYDRIIARLMEMGIEADLILFHAYDRWGFSQMSMEENLFYLKYMVARYGAFRNVWWSLANEYELLRHLDAQQWNILGTTVAELDPYHHLVSIHNNETFFDYSEPWITHCSCQREDHHKTTEFTTDLRALYKKPVVWDEVGYEGDFPHCWGNFTPEELVRRNWDAIVRGGYCGHGETYLNDTNIIWWANGGRLCGESADRFGFARRFLEDVPGCGLKLRPRDDVHIQWDDYCAVPEDPAFERDFLFFYYSIWRPAFRDIWIDDDTWFDVDVIDTWNMTITPAGRHKGHFRVDLPVRQYMGIRLRRAAQNEAEDEGESGWKEQ